MKWALYNLTTTTSFGGVETNVWGLAQELTSRGHQVSIYGGLSSRYLPFLNNDLEILAFPYRQRESFPYLGSRATKFIERLSFAYKAIPELCRRGYERLLIFKSFDLGPAIYAKQKIGVKVGFLSGGTEFYPGLAWLARRVDYLASVSAFNATQLAKVTGINFQINHLGVNPQLFCPTSPDKKLAANYSLAKNDEILVTAVRLVALKGIQRIFKVLVALAPSRPRLKLLIAGEGIYRPILEQLARKLALQNRVYFLGYLEPTHLASFYALGTLAVFPSIGEEALGLSIAEAMACGLPVVASHLGGVAEVVGRAGVLVPSQDDLELTRVIEKLLNNPSLRNHLSKIGRERIINQFTWSACAERLEQGMI